MTTEYILLGWLLLAAVLDVRFGRIPNGLCVGGLLCAAVPLFLHPSYGQVWAFLQGMFLPYCLLILFWYLHLIGAGDIKLLCMAGAFLGPGKVLDLMAWTVYLALFYLLLRMFVWLICSGGSLVKPRKARATMPLAPAVALAQLLLLLWKT